MHGSLRNPRSTRESYRKHMVVLQDTDDRACEVEGTHSLTHGHAPRPCVPLRPRAVVFFGLFKGVFSPFFGRCLFGLF